MVINYYECTFQDAKSQEPRKNGALPVQSLKVIKRYTVTQLPKTFDTLLRVVWKNDALVVE